MLVQVLVNCEVKSAASEGEATKLAQQEVKHALESGINADSDRRVKVCKVVDTLWKCPECGRVISHSYDSMADVGNPLCVGEDHEEEMERV